MVMAFTLYLHRYNLTAMKTITTIITTYLVLILSNPVTAQINSPQNPNVIDTSTVVTPVDTFIDSPDPDPVVSPPPPSPNLAEPSIAPNTQPEPPGTPHPGTTVDPRLNETSFKFDQNDFLKSVSKTASCDGSGCAVLTSNEK